MKETTLTQENLEAILNAMSKIKEIDRSQYFKQYLKEVLKRLDELERIKTLKPLNP